MKYGYDVSSIQGAIDWSKVPADFVYIKTSTGNDMGVDPTFAANVRGCQNAGVPCGAYHFAYPLPPRKPGRAAIEQAQAFWYKSGGLGQKNGELPPALDLEWPAPGDWDKWCCSAAQIAQWGLDCLDAITQRWGKLPLVYTYPDFWLHVQGPADFAKYPLWLADYAHWPAQRPVDGQSPRELAPWSSWAVWQHSGGGLKLPGAVPVDGDCMTDETLEAML